MERRDGFVQRRVIAILEASVNGRFQEDSDTVSGLGPKTQAGRKPTEETKILLNYGLASQAASARRIQEERPDRVDVGQDQDDFVGPCDGILGMRRDVETLQPQGVSFGGRSVVGDDGQAVTVQALRDGAPSRPVPSSAIASGVVISAPVWRDTQYGCGEAHEVENRSFLTGRTGLRTEGRAD